MRFRFSKITSVIVLIFLFVSTDVFAGRTINSATLNGATTQTVAPLATISAAVTVTTANNNDNNWQSTGWRIGNSGSYTCVDHSNHNNSGTNTETFSITAPSTSGTYTVSFIAYNDNNCLNGASATYSLTNALTVTSNGGGSVNVNERPFALRNSLNLRGNVTVIGNTVLCVTNNQGACYDYTGSNANNQLDLQYIDVDNITRTYNNSSKASLSIPNNAVVKWAGIYTQGYLNGNSQTTIANAITTPIYVTFPTIGIINSTPTVVDILANGSDGYTYDTYAPLNALIGKTGAQINGWVTGANIKADTGIENSGLGNFGAWTLVIIYENVNETLKNLSVFDGYRRIASNANSTVNININGFKTPLNGNVFSTLSLFVGEGDKNIQGDKLALNNTYLNSSNAFYSSLIGVTADPSFSNTEGIDIQNFSVGQDGNNSHPQIIGNNQTSATITFSTTGDTYFPSLAIFATDIYSPAIGNFDKNATVTYASNQYCGESKDLRAATIHYDLTFENTGTEAASNVDVYDNFSANGILDYLDMTQTTTPTTQLISGPAGSNISCDQNSTGVNCHYGYLPIGSVYKMSFDVKVKSSLNISNDITLGNTANAHYYNASTGEEITQIASSNMQLAGGICAILPIAEYRFDECRWSTNPGDVLDATSNGYNATISGTGATAVDSIPTAGGICRAAKMDGNSYMRVDGSFPNLTSSFSITGWFNTADINKIGQRIFIDDETNSGGYGLSLNDTGAHYVRFYDRSQPSIGIIDASSATISANHWYFVAAVADTVNNVRQLYVYDNDGTLLDQRSLAINTALGSDSGYASIGGETTNGETAYRFNGYLDEIKLFNQALNQTQIETILSNERSGLNYDGSTRVCNECPIGFVFDYRLDECDRNGLSVIDYGTAANDATAKHEAANTDGLYARTCDDSGAIVCANAAFKGEGYSVPYNPWYYTARYYMEAPDTDAFSPLAQGYSAMTLYAWFKTSSTQIQTVLTKAGSASDSKEYRLWIDGGILKFSLWDKNGTPTDFTVANGVNDGNWHHTAVTVETVGANNIKVRTYLDGSLQSTTTSSYSAGYSTNTSGNFYIGAMNWGSLTNFFDGNIDELHMRPAADTAQTISAIYANERQHFNYDGSARTCSCNCSTPVIVPAVTFDAWDTFRSIDDRNISTKIVNKPFYLTVASINEANNGLQDFNGTVCAQIIDTVSNTQLDRQCKAWSNLQSDSSLVFNTAKVSANAKVRLAWIKDDFTGTFTDGSENNSTNASDRFAIRPNAFSISAPNATAGSDFNISLSAPVYGTSAPSPGYNETEGTTFDLNINEHKAGCTLGIFNPPAQGFTFLNGLKTLTTRYNEIGQLDISISDLSKPCTTRFASIDCDDANVSDGSNFSADLTPIGLAQTQIIIRPDHFDLNTSLSNINSGTYTYLSNDLNMSAPLSVKIAAKNAENNTTINYDSACYANPTTLTLQHTLPPASLSNLLYRDEMHHILGSALSSNDLILNLPASFFTNGQTTLTLQINFNRADQSPVNPFNFEVNGSNITDIIYAIDTTRGTLINKGSAIFLYGRAHPYDITTNIATTPNPVEIEIYSTSSGGFVAGMPQNVLHWYRNTAHDDNNTGQVYAGSGTSLTIDTSASPLNGQDPIQITYNGTAAYTTGVKLDIPEWLWYSPSGKAYDYVSADCKAHPCFLYRYIPIPAGSSDTLSNTGGTSAGVESGTFNGADFTIPKSQNTSSRGVKLFR